MVAAAAALAYVVALATHPVRTLLNGFDLEVYLGGAHQALHHAANLYSWHYQHDLGIQFTYTPFAALPAVAPPEVSGTPVPELVAGVMLAL